jgi:hypothetical protein
MFINRTLLNPISIWFEQETGYCNSYAMLKPVALKYGYLVFL